MSHADPRGRTCGRWAASPDVHAAHVPDVARLDLAIAGIFPLAGFFSKDEILGSTAASGHWALYAVGLFTAGLTAFYMFRLVSMTFFGKARGGAIAGSTPTRAPRR